MAYRVVDVDSVEPEPDRPCECRKLSGPAELDEVAINRFRADPGEQVPLAYHSHRTQEEVFYVLSGTLSVDTPERTYEVAAGDLFAVGPGDPQRAHNAADADGPVTLLAIGAPPDDDAVPYEPEGDETDAGGSDED